MKPYYHDDTWWHSGRGGGAEGWTGSPRRKSTVRMSMNQSPPLATCTDCCVHLPFMGSENEAEIEFCLRHALARRMEQVLRELVSTGGHFDDVCLLCLVRDHARAIISELDGQIAL